MLFKIILLTFLCVAISLSHAVARIDIVPQKIIIENRERNGEFTVLNLMDRAGTFRIEIVNFEQNQDGVYQELSAPLSPDFDPQSIARISPRQFMLQEGGRQKIRLSLRKPASLPEGEYRFHVKAIRLMKDNERIQDDPNNINVLANIGVTIPVVIRHGQITSDAKIKNIRLVDAANTQQNKNEIHMDIDRTGNASTIGVLEIFWQGDGKPSKRIGRITNMNIFPDIDTRHIKLPITEMPSGSGQLMVRYANSIDKGQIFDQKIIDY